MEGDQEKAQDFLLRLLRSNRIQGDNDFNYLWIQRKSFSDL